jgi:hypothetical protein
MKKLISSQVAGESVFGYNAKDEPICGLHFVFHI